MEDGDMEWWIGRLELSHNGPNLGRLSVLRIPMNSGKELRKCEDRGGKQYKDTEIMKNLG
jgi:hypothetical protein